VTEGDLRRALGRLLAAGVVLSAVLLGAGLALWMAGGATASAGWLLQAGLVALMATPVLGVLASLVEYVAERDWMFVGVTLTVLAILALTVFISLLG